MISRQVPQQTLLGIKGQHHHHHCQSLILKNNNNNSSKNKNDNDPVPDLRYHCQSLILKNNINNNNNNNANDNDQVPDLRYVGLFFESQSELLGRLNQQQCHGQITLAFAFVFAFSRICFTFCKNDYTRAFAFCFY